MSFQILKKDMVKRKAINFILFLFIILATIFLASSVNNILVVAKSLDYFMEVANVPDINVIVNSDQEKTEIDHWLKKQKEQQLINNYDYNRLITVANKSIQINKGKKEIETRGASTYIGKMDVSYNKVFNQEGKEFRLNGGEIAISTSFAKSNQLAIGDEIEFKVGEEQNNFKVKEIIKDAAFGNDMVGMIRFMISHEDYNRLEEKASTMGLYYIDTENITTFQKELNKEAFPSVINVITQDTYKMVYTFDLIMAALLILIGICLIIIAMLVLRFTLIFTIEEQYQEIGILKAIGLRDHKIKKIYLIKYFAIVMVGAVIGLALSFPISNVMITSMSENILMENGNANYGANILCALFIVMIVLLFCYFCTRKLNKISAMTTIRGGETGERFHRRKGIRLAKCKLMKVPFYLGTNDIFSHLKRFAVLMITFAMSFILITIPLNTVNTMRSDEMKKKFSLDPESPLYVQNIEQENEEKYTKVEQLKEGIRVLKEKMMAKGYEVQVTASAIYFINYAGVESSEKQNLMTIQLMGDKIHFLEYTQGKEPLLENEIAFSEIIMKENGWNIGDYIKAKINGEERLFLITGTYSDYTQLGKSARLNPAIRCDKEIMFDYWKVIVSIDSSMGIKALVNHFNQEFPTYKWMSGQQVIDQNVGGIQETLSSLILPMTVMLTLVIMLITILMEKLFIVRERREIAMLKSIGCTNQNIRHFHIIRMTLIAVCSMILAIPLSLLSNIFLLQPIFAIMGANVSIQVQPLEVYLLYPSILLIGIILATTFAARDIKKIHTREMNTME